VNGKLVQSEPGTIGCNPSLTRLERAPTTSVVDDLRGSR
jgi:hypothetical protein